MTVTGTEQRVYGTLVSTSMFPGIIHDIYVSRNNYSGSANSLLTYPQLDTTNTGNNIILTSHINQPVPSYGLTVYIHLSTGIDYKTSSIKSALTSSHIFDITPTSTVPLNQNKILVNIRNGQTTYYILSNTTSTINTGPVQNAMIPPDSRYFTMIDTLLYFTYPPPYVDTIITITLNNYRIYVDGNQVKPNSSGFVRFGTGETYIFIPPHKIPFVDKNVDIPI